jgi:hypothetical protein
MDEHNPGGAIPTNGRHNADADMERALLESLKHAGAGTEHMMFDEEALLQQVLEESRKEASRRR